MKIKRLEIENYRSIEELRIAFDDNYTALCGQNNSGKSNIIKAIRSVCETEDSRSPYVERHQTNYGRDFPVWKKSELGKKPIRISALIHLSDQADAGLMNFLGKYHPKKPVSPKSIELLICREYTEAKPALTRISLDGEEITKEIDKNDVLQRLQTSQLVIFHNSTNLGRAAYYAEAAPWFSGLSGEDRSALTSINQYVSRQLKKVAKKHQENLSALLQKLTDRHKVGLQIPSLDFDFLPFQLSLADKNADISLEDWGSGTRNRTLILLSLFRASLACKNADPSRVTPIVIIEEPECFLHPSAQAEFGRVLQELAYELGVQVIVTTHSPYLLSQKSPDSNRLVQRRRVYKKLQGTFIEDTAGDNWMDPFGEVLGVNSAEFKPWKDVFFNAGADILLVEGESDKDYLELLRDPAHGKNQLRFAGEIFPYGGKDNLKNTVLLRFVKTRYRRYFITFDLDAYPELQRTLASLHMDKNLHYLPIGKSGAGKDRIEGLLPDEIIRAVRAENQKLVDEAMDGVGDIRRDAKQKLKELYLDRFKKTANIQNGDYKEFYPIVTIINKALCSLANHKGVDPTG